MTSSFKVHVITDDALGNMSYLVEVGDGTAISIDPRRDVGEHLDTARERGLQIAAVFETHLHADFVSGSRELAADIGTEIYAAADADLRFPHHAVIPGEIFAFAGVSVEVIPTPGHTPEHVAYLISDGSIRALFSGGSLIVGGAARTDLTGAEHTDELSRAQYASLRKLSSLPDETVLYPTHGGGSFCSTGAARSAISTIGDERAANPLLAIENEEEFVDRLRRGFGSYPRYFAHLRDINRNGAPLLASLASVRELSADEAHHAVSGGAWLIDSRPVQQWARAHAQGSVSIELRPAFASWLGWAVPFGEPVVLMLLPEQVRDAVRLARRIGYDAIEGWIGFESWRDAGLAASSLEEMDPAEAFDRADAGTVMLDVRQANEFAARHISGAAHLELGDIIAGKTPDANRVITYCGHGERSATAASFLARRGIEVANLRGGTAAWRGAGYPFEP
jgi:glyoxylase-like metal-dependent hydrolase (beta-lactamase superfamily II)/rhodanese-related sulfurtransferase